MKNEIYERSSLYKLRHSAAHVLAMAAREFDPAVKLAIGPPTENGFYYDFEFSKPITEENLYTLEERMAAIIRQNLPIEKKKIAYKDALKQAKADNQPYKAELIEEIQEPELNFYGIGELGNPDSDRRKDFWDLCKGPHVKSTGEIKAFKLLSIAGAYWRGSEQNPMLTRIYGTAFESKGELEKFMAELEAAKKHDHRRLGRELGIFTIIPAIGSGLPVWLPKGATLFRLLEDYIRNLEIDAGYQHVITSELGRVELYQTSGHLEHYADSMYPPIDLEGESFILRPMNCPHHIEIYKQGLHSYRELPIRLAEFGEVFRLEKSGELSGLQRVRSFTINDSHIFCREDQVKSEFKAVLTLILQVYRKLELKDYWLRLSLHDQTNKAKYGGNLALWEKTESYLRQALKEMRVEFVEGKDEAAFYGPKVDLQMKNILGKEETISTVQLDFYMPERFGLEYVDRNGKKHPPVIIHRAILGSMERFIGIYLEKTGGELPLWLAPAQVKVIPVSEKASAYATEVVNQLRHSQVRVELDETAETLGKRIRNAELEKIPYILVVGAQEVKDKTVTLRVRHTAKQSTVRLADFLGRFQQVGK